MITRTNLVSIIAPLILAITACSRPQIQVLATLTTARGAEQLANCMQTYIGCDGVRSETSCEPQ
jgi:3-deoxy-D-manno-octulosonic-acid transferase